MAVWNPLATVCRALWLDKPREWADQALDRDTNGGIFELPSATATTATKEPGPTATPEPPKQLVRTPTLEEPLRLWIGGDSVVKILGEAMVRQAAESGLLDATHEPQLQSGSLAPTSSMAGRLNRVSKLEPNYEVIVVMSSRQRRPGHFEPNGTVTRTKGTPGAGRIPPPLAGAMAC